MTRNKFCNAACGLFIAVVLVCSFVYGQADSSDSSKASLALQRRVAVFQQIYVQLKQHYVENEMLQLPADIESLAKKLSVHSSIDWSLIHHNAQPISLDEEKGMAMHTILLHDSSEVGDGGSRVLLFADGHIEISTWE